MKKLIVIAALSLGGCGSSATEADRHIREGSSSLFNPKGEFDEVAARVDAIADIADTSFNDVGDTSTCTDDCSGHAAGFEWAKENAPSDPDSCSGENDSFDQGCEVFHEAVNKRVEQMRDEWKSS